MNDSLKESALPNTHIMQHHIPGTPFTRLTISMPYLILYESQDPAADTSNFFEFSEYSNTIHHSTYQDYLSLGEMSLHSHDFYELTFVLSGELNLQIENENIVYHAGDCYLCNKNIHHRERLSGNSEIVLFLLKEEYIRDVITTNYYYDEAGNEHSLGSFFLSLFTANTQNPFFDAKEYVDFKPLDKSYINRYIQVINQLIEEISSKHSGKSHMIKALLCRFIELLEDSGKTKRTIHEASLSVEEQIVVDIANAYLSKPELFTRNEIEQLTGYNGDYVERIVKRQTGMTLQQYGRSFQMKRASMLLTDTDLTVSKICDSLGYSNRSYFNRVFKEQFGMIPNDYRKKNRGIQKQ